MKNTVIIILFAMSLLSSCTIRQDYNQQLLKADSLMQLRPDSALNILKSMSSEKLSTRADNAYYALLLTQAQDKNFVVQKDDSLIQIAVHYYGEFYQFNLSSCIRQQNSLTAQFVSFSLSNLANIFYPPQFLQ